ncbi:helix-turn-helix transcriptional regulator [Cohnella cholangitidis]|uniref:helix-turn-helix transcriptional regulator n=1 Tax=Cohnella cholangitidis TaxID=2598458 RepID=UPI0015FB311B|nr:AraC family transcriptional regulator [Cohnella cholangitidis]
MPKKEESEDPHDYIVFCKKYIKEHFNQSIGFAQISALLGLSPNYLSTLFRESEGISFIKYLTKLGMEYAASQFYHNPDLKISSVAESCGYMNSKHFYYVFKQYFNQTPGEYQKAVLEARMH